jgi:hypothetical protein
MDAIAENIRWGTLLLHCGVGFRASKAANRPQPLTNRRVRRRRGKRLSISLPRLRHQARVK